MPGGPHDAMFALQRFVHWMSDDDITVTAAVGQHRTARSGCIRMARAERE